MDENTVITLDNVSKTYSAGVPALQGVSFQIQKGEFVFLVGNSGSGKSTILRLLLKELDPTSGRICVNGQELTGMKHKQIAKYRRGIGVVFQDFRLLKDRNVFENVAFAQRVVGKSNHIIERQVPEMLALMGLSEKVMAFPNQLSGGEQQRVAIARALINKPGILLADEPTGNLDPTNSWEIMTLLDEINEKGTTVIVVTHNQEIVDAMQKRVITMQKGSLISDEQKGGYTYGKY